MNRPTWTHDNLYTFLKKVYEESTSLIHEPEFVNVKTKNDFVTSLDYAIDKVVAQEIKRYEPSALVFSEENAWPEESNVKEYWILDPLDGTCNFVNQIHIYGISIAKIVDDEVVLAAVIDLPRGEIFSALKGQGFRIDNQVQDPLPSHSKMAVLSTGYLKIFGSEHVIADGYKIRNLGSQAIHLAYVAAGRLDLCISLEACIWDDIAGSLLVSESGGVYKNVFSKESFLKLGQEMLGLRSVAKSRLSSDNYRYVDEMRAVL
jgi:myo-inositol-1(or 4)-monophosphatase